MGVSSFFRFSPFTRRDLSPMSGTTGKPPKRCGPCWRRRKRHGRPGVVFGVAWDGTGGFGTSHGASPRSLLLSRIKKMVGHDPKKWLVMDLFFLKGHGDSRYPFCSRRRWWLNLREAQGPFGCLETAQAIGGFCTEAAVSQPLLAFDFDGCPKFHESA